MSLATPSKINIPFAESGNKNAINDTLQNGDSSNKATYTYGFPSVTMTPKASGGLPPFGRDMNGILYSITAMLQYQQAGGTYTYDSSFATTIGGYGQGALVQQADLSGFWVSTANNNTSDPESSSTDWMPLDSGSHSVSVTTADVTLTNGEAAHPVLIVSGTLTGSRIIYVPTFRQIWTIVNNSVRGTYTLTIKTANGTGVTLSNPVEQVVCDGTNIYRVTAEHATTVPVGGMVWHWGSTVPSGYLLANGQAVSRTLYPALFSVLGTTYGDGDGSTTFNLPDVTDRFVRGGTVSQVGTKVADSIKSHTHSVTQTAHTHGVTDNGHTHTASTASAGAHTHGRGTMEITGSFQTPDDVTPSGAFYFIRNEGNESGGSGQQQIVGFQASRSWTGSTSSAGAHTHTVTVDSKKTGVAVNGATANISIGSTGNTETAPKHIYALPIIRAV